MRVRHERLFERNPVNCVSHDAAATVKRLCGRTTSARESFLPLAVTWRVLRFNRRRGGTKGPGDE